MCLQTQLVFLFVNFSTDTDMISLYFLTSVTISRPAPCLRKAHRVEGSKPYPENGHDVLTAVLLMASIITMES